MPLAESGRSLGVTEFQFHSGCLDRKEEARERRPGRLCQMRNTYGYVMQAGSILCGLNELGKNKGVVY